MRKFKFRLEKLLEWRNAIASEAKAAYLGAAADRISREHSLEEAKERLAHALRQVPSTLPEKLSNEAFLNRLEDERAVAESVVQAALEDEALALAAWRESEKEAEAIRKLRERAQEAWQIEFDRFEQKELDEWAVQQRKL
ncbi:MAG: flagellar FliJ family protein [Fimbriimonadaceae bacterium]|nr:flagellar FliJ family protein [Fimbriimonadaceae bacterium]QYK54702.1 MAG: flagellar FliJ family protein [Fimbriimonadaceae bacterium]